MSVPSQPQLTGYLNPSAFYSLSLQSHDPSAFFIEANDIVFQSRLAMLYPIYPCLAIPRLLDCFHDLLVLSLRVEFFRGQGRDLGIVLYEFPKLVFRKALLAYIQRLSGRKEAACCGCILSDGIFFPLHFKLTGSKGSSDSDV